MQPVVTVGLDGSPESLAAARWAADEAEKRGLALRLLHAWPLLAPEPARVAAPEVDQNYWAKRLVHTAQAELQAHHPGLTVLGTLVPEDAQVALVRAAAESEMVVLGSRGLETVESYIMGDVSMPVVARAGRPVVLVRAERAEQPASGSPGRVVVALGLRTPGDELLDFAFHSAAARKVPLLAVHGHSVPLHARMPWGADHTVTEEITKKARKELGRALRPWHEKYPQVEVVDSVRLTSPAKAVLKAAEGAALLVVGRRAHRRGGTPHLGPVAHAALHHGRCPVAVVPHD
ncbi:universal stress protein [Streptomyces sp. DSM 15324]|uniref:universal stress protein n=1 Tax=Streptomyces sp. DSM 15324 TaxID=1739111 RepID=UPI000748C1E8|nr:universal stress protein [Streptomyces sp. DSM 15324]KUO08248.1 stress-inducible protein [Streptomyces sp. DSM 15324]